MSIWRKIFGYSDREVQSYLQELKHLQEERLQKDGQIARQKRFVAKYKEFLHRLRARTPKEISSAPKQTAAHPAGQPPDGKTWKEREKRLKQQYDNLQDDYDALQSDYNNLRKRHADTKTELEACQDLCAKQKRQLAEKDRSLQKTEKDLQFSEQARSLIEQILMAPPIQNDYHRHLKAAVVDLTHYITDELILLFRMFYGKKEFDTSYKNTLFGKDLERWKIRREKTWLHDKITVALLGEFSAGKTSIINALLRQNDPHSFQLPIDVRATTAIPTYISGSVGKLADFRLVSPRNEHKTVGKEVLEMMQKETLKQIPGLQKLVKYFVIQYPNPNLQKITILDTPGFSSSDAEDAQRTLDVINECDALFWVLDVNQGLEKTSKKTIESFQKNLSKPLYIVLNKVDTKPKGEVDKLETYIAKQLQGFHIAVDGILRFSVKQPESLSRLIDTVLQLPSEEEGKDAYLERLFEKLEQMIKSYKEQIAQFTQEATALQDQQLQQESELRRVCSQIEGKLESTRFCIRESYLPKKFYRWTESYNLSTEDFKKIKNEMGYVQENVNALEKLVSPLTTTAKQLQEKYTLKKEILKNYSTARKCKILLKKKFQALPDVHLIS